MFIGYGYAYQMTQSVGRARREQLNTEQTNTVDDIIIIDSIEHNNQSIAPVIVSLFYLHVNDRMALGRHCRHGIDSRH